MKNRSTLRVATDVGGGATGVRGLLRAGVIGAGVTVGAMAGVMACCALGGCAFNTAPVNMKLSRAQIVERVQKRFYVGQPSVDVQAQLTAMDLRFDAGMLEAPELTSSHRGLIASVAPGGLHSTYMPVDNRILFWFTPDGTLAGAAYREVKRSESGHVQNTDTPIELPAAPEKPA